MSLATTAVPTPVTTVAVNKPQVGELLFVAAHLPLVAAYYARLWELPHYQFFPLALIGAFLLARRGDREPKCATPPSLVGLALTLGMSLLCFAVILDSPWLGAVAALVDYSVWRISRYGLTWREVLPAAAMIAVTLRPPLGLDTRLIADLQRITARSADEMLDVLGVLHSLSGNVIELPGRRLLVEEACSGVNSLFSAAACVLFYLLWNRCGWIRSILLFVVIPIWVVFANVLRVVAVAVLCDRWNIAADVGIWHDILGFVTFAFAVGMILSTERLLTFYAKLVERPLTAASDPMGTSSVPIIDNPMKRRWQIIGIVAMVIGVAQIPVLITRAEHFASEWHSDALPEFGETWLSGEFATWHRMGYEVVRRDRNSPFGRYSQQWSLDRSTQRAVLSLDYPFYGWHELTECYEAQGWRMESRRVMETSSGVPFGVEVALRHDLTQRYGRLYFALLTYDGHPYAARKHGEVDEWYDRASERLRELFGRSSMSKAPAADQLTYQCQLFIESYVSPTAREDAEHLDLFQRFDACVSERLSHAESVAAEERTP